MLRKARAILALGSAAVACAVNAGPVELITNGGFETGTFAGWTVTDLDTSLGSWFVDDADGSTPVSSLSTVGPASGSFYAVTDQIGSGTHVLEQAFTVPLGATSVVLTFDMFINDDSGVGPIADPAGLDHTGAANQHARVDIMVATAGAFSTAPADVVANLVPPSVDAGTNPNPYTAYLFDLTGLVGPGGTFKLRFGAVENQRFLNQGVDDVSIIADVARVPEPASLGLVTLGLAGLGFSRRRQQL